MIQLFPGGGADSGRPRSKRAAARRILLIVGRDNWQKSQRMSRALLGGFRDLGLDLRWEDPAGHWIFRLQTAERRLRRLPHAVRRANLRLVQLLYGLLHWTYFRYLLQPIGGVEDRAARLARRNLHRDQHARRGGPLLEGKVGVPHHFAVAEDADRLVALLHVGDDGDLGREIEELVAGALLSGFTYFGLVKIPARHLFAVTSALIAFLAAGMAAQCVGLLQQAGVMTVLLETAWNTSWLLPDDTIPGRLLHTIVGYSDRPSIAQVIAYFAVLLCHFGMMRLASPAPRKLSPA